MKPITSTFLISTGGFAVLVVMMLLSCARGFASPPVEKPMMYAGFDVENPQWMKRDQQDDVLAQLAANGITLIRFPLVPSSGTDFSSIVAFTERAFKAGIKADVIVSPSYAPDAPPRPAVAGTMAAWPMPGLSSADPRLFARNYGPVLHQLDDAGVVLAGIELGNEINWPQFNGDFPVPGQGRTLSLLDLETTDLGRKVAKGYRAYLDTLKELKTIRDTTRLNTRTPIVLAGLADVSPLSPPASDKVDDVDIATTIDFMRAHGGDALVDAYAVHTYAANGVVNTEASKSRLASYLDRYVLSRCGTSAGGKPCWITEWGASQASGCPFFEGILPNRIEAFLDVLKPRVSSGAVEALIYADWADPIKLGLFRCGRLSRAGTLYRDYFRRSHLGADATSSPKASHLGAKR